MPDEYDILSEEETRAKNLCTVMDQLKTYQAQNDVQKLSSYLLKDPEFKRNLAEAGHLKRLAQALRLTGRSAAVSKTSAQISNVIHHLRTGAAATQATRGVIAGSGLVGAAVGLLSFLIVPAFCAYQKRRPNASEWRSIGLSGTMFTLGMLAAFAVGGPLAAGAMIITISSLAFGNTIFSVAKDFFTSRKLKKETSALTIEMEELKKEQEEFLKKIDKFKLSLDVESSKLSAEAKNTLKSMTDELKNLDNKIDSISAQFAQRTIELNRLKDSQHSRFEQAKTGLVLASGAAAIVGAALAMTPLAPIGLLVSAVSAVTSLATLVAGLIVNKIRSHKLKKAEKKQAALNQTSNQTELPIKEDKTLQHSSEFKMADALSDHHPKEALETALKNTKQGELLALEKGTDALENLTNPVDVFPFLYKYRDLIHETIKEDPKALSIILRKQNTKRASLEELIRKGHALVRSNPVKLQDKTIKDYFFSHGSQDNKPPMVLKMEQDLHIKFDLPKESEGCSEGQQEKDDDSPRIQQH